MKYFKTSQKAKLNNTFVSVWAVKLYREYAEESCKVGPEIVEMNNILKDPIKKDAIFKSDESFDEFYKKSNELRQKADSMEKQAYEIVMTILEDNKQSFEVTLKNVLKRMTMSDINNFILESCTD